MLKPCQCHPFARSTGPRSPPPTRPRTPWPIEEVLDMQISTTVETTTTRVSLTTISLKFGGPIACKASEWRRLHILDREEAKARETNPSKQPSPQTISQPSPQHDHSSASAQLTLRSFPKRHFPPLPKSTQSPTTHPVMERNPRTGPQSKNSRHT